MNCPICGVKLKYKRYGVEHIITEEYETCVDGCNKYYYEFKHGFSKTVVGEVEVNEEYTDTEEESKSKGKIIDKAVEYEKIKLSMNRNNRG